MFRNYGSILIMSIFPPHVFVGFTIFSIRVARKPRLRQKQPRRWEEEEEEAGEGRRREEKGGDSHAEGWKRAEEGGREGAREGAREGTGGRASRTYQNNTHLLRLQHYSIALFSGDEEIEE